MSKSWLPAKSELHEKTRGLSLEETTDETRAVAAKLVSQDVSGETPLVMPIYHSSTYRIPSVESYCKILEQGGSIYSRLGSPNAQAAECAINALEGGAGTLVFTSGMAAVTTTLTAFLRPGDHVIACQPFYSGTHKFLSKYLTNFGIELTLVPIDAGIAEYEKHIKNTTKVLYGETPCNPLVQVQDLEAFGKLGKKHDVITIVDSTLASPYLQKPLQYGIDVVVHSGTKYLGGHSDLIAGVVTTASLEHWQYINVYRSTLGNILSPFDCSLLIRGIKSVHVRVERACDNAQALAEFLAAHPKVEKVHYPGLPSHPGHAVAKKQMKKFGAMISFEVKGGLIPASKVVEHLRVIELAVSLGGVESLIEHPASMTHGKMIMSDEEREEGQISDGLIRFSVGIENVEDLKKDLEYGLSFA